MILVVAVNPALDVTHHVAGVDWSGVNRPQQGRVSPGGKGLNVARTLRALGTDTLVLGLAGGVTGETRRTFAVVDTRRHHTALFNEPGPAVSESEWAAMCVLYEKALAGSS